jgi:hypothetical protein
MIKRKSAKSSAGRGAFKWSFMLLCIILGAELGVVITLISAGVGR